MWILAGAAGALAIITRLEPLDAAGHVVGRVWTVLLFLVAITIVAELADAAGVFDVAAREAAVLARGRTVRLFLLVAVLGTLTTLVLSLDTTAVLLTPVVLAMAEQLGVSPLPFAMTTVWLANTASLLLPVSNLTNLLALHALHLSVGAFAARMWLPQLGALVVTLLVLGLRYRRLLRGGFEPGPRPDVPDRTLFVVSAAVCLAVGPLFVLGLPVSGVAAGGAAVLLAAFALRRRGVLRFAMVPWRLVVLVVGLFLVVDAGHRHGLDRLIGAAAGHGGAGVDLLRLAGSSAAASNLVNNLPSYIAFEPVADGGRRLLAVLVGTNLGPLVLLWGSLATLLWRERCRARGVTVSAKEFALVGVVGVPLLLVVATLALSVTA